MIKEDGKILRQKLKYYKISQNDASKIMRVNPRVLKMMLDGYVLCYGASERLKNFVQARMIERNRKKKK